MRKDALLDRLAAFGIEGNEAEAYFHLSRLGPTKAGDLANEAKLSRTDVYRVMDALEEKGFVERTVDQPVRFIPVPIEDALARVVENRRRSVASLETEREALAEDWPRPGQRTEPEAARLSIHRDRAQIAGLLERLVDAARDEVLIACMKRSLARFESMGLLERLEAREQEALTVRILTEVDDTNLATARRFSPAAEIRHVDLPAYFQVVLSDARRAALFVAVDPLTSTSEGATTALHLTSQDFLLAQKALYDTLWAQGIDLAARADELETGTPAERVEVVRGRWIRFEKMEEMLYRADDEVRLALAAADGDRLAGSNLPRVLSRRAEEDVRVRVLTEAEIEQPLAGVKTRKGATPSGTTGLVVDGEEHLAVAGGGSPGEGTADPGEWSIHATVRQAVERAGDRFEAAWEAAG